MFIFRRSILPEREGRREEGRRREEEGWRREKEGWSVSGLDAREAHTLLKH